MALSNHLSYNLHCLKLLCTLSFMFTLTADTREFKREGSGYSSDTL